MKGHPKGTMNKVAIIAVSLILAMALGLGGCTTPPTPTPTPLMPMGEYKAYQAVEIRLDGMATSVEAKRYLADFMHLSEGFWQITYDEKYETYYIIAEAIRSSPPNTYYYRPFWSEAIWVLDSNDHISPDASARYIEADLMDLSAGGTLEPNPNYSP